jgi:WD40 repeat protein
VTAARDLTARVWDARSGRGLAVLEGHAQPVNRVAVNAESTRIATASFDGTARLWTPEGEMVADLRGHEGPLTHVTFSPAGGSW